MITNDVSDYINLLVRIAHIICNHPLLCGPVYYSAPLFSCFSSLQIFYTFGSHACYGSHTEISLCLCKVFVAGK